MPTIQSPNSPSGAGRAKIYVGALIIAVAAGGLGYYVATKHAVSPPQNPPGANGAPMSADEMSKRSQAYKEAIVASTTQPLPTTPEDVITQFWTAASQKDTDTLVRLCPGSMKTDYVTLTKYVPSAPKAIGPGEPHPTAPGVLVYPTTIVYGGGTKKIYKMAVAKTLDGHYTIDGRNTVWR